MNQFKFSVVIAAYNSDLWISKAINSIINQTLNFEKNIQIIIVNDGSTDNTGQICQGFKANIQKILNTLLMKRIWVHLKQETSVLNNLVANILIF